MVCVCPNLEVGWEHPNLWSSPLHFVPFSHLCQAHVLIPIPSRNPSMWAGKWWEARSRHWSWSGKLVYSGRANWSVIRSQPILRHILIRLKRSKATVIDPLIFNQQKVVPLQIKIFGADRSRQGVCDRHRDRWGWGGVNGRQIWARLPQTCSCSLHQTLGCYVISVHATHLSCVTFWLWCVKCSIFSSDICVKFGQVVQCSQIIVIIVHDNTSYIQGSVDNHGHGHKKYVHWTYC